MSAPDARLGVFLFAACLSVPGIAAADAVTVYVGTYTTGGSASKGIYRLRFDRATGALAADGEPTPSVNPSFLALHPSGRFLYAVNETGDSRKDEGGLSAFAVDEKTGALTFLNREPSGGGGPCYVSLDKGGRHVLVANYDGGSVSVRALGVDGRLGPRTAFVQHEPTAAKPAVHAHSIDLDADGRFALVADLGLDQVLVYKFVEAKGTLAPHGGISLPAKSGPRHLAWRPDGHAYVIDETSSQVTAFSYEAGMLTELQTSGTLPPGFTGANTTAEIAFTPDGRFLYGSNRGHDSLAIFAVNAAGMLKALGHQSTLGRTPRHFAIDPTGEWLLAANQDSDSIVVFRIDKATGALTAVGSPLSVPRPVCLVFARR